MDLHRIAIRAVFAFVVLQALLRVSGKRTVRQGTSFDFVLALVMGDLVDDVLWGEVAAAHFVTAMGALSLCHLATAELSYRSLRFSALVEGEPRVLMRRGTPVPAALRAERVSEPEMEQMLREHGLARDDWGDVESAQLEPSGALSVRLEPSAREGRRLDAWRRRRRLRR